MTDKFNAVSMDVLARFAILPGASDLMEAFAVIPPGPMRDAVIHLAKTTAATYTGGGAAQVPQPIPVIGPGVRPVPQIASRTGRAPPTESIESEIVNLRMAGRSPAQIAQQLRCHVSTVYAELKAARNAGVPIPKRQKFETPPQRTWHVHASDLSAQGLAQSTRAAQARGIELDAYMGRRQLALRLAMEGADYDAILKATGETDAKIVSAWLSAARAAGYKVPYIQQTATDHTSPSVEPPTLATALKDETA